MGLHEHFWGETIRDHSVHGGYPPDADAGGSARAARAAARWRVALLVVLVIVSLALRVPRLGGVFASADNAELAARIVSNRGYAWMVRERYGLLINVLVKLSAATFSSLGITLTEFWWRLPLAVVGSFQAPLAYLFLKRLRCREAGAVFGAFAVACLPLHVMQSRYLWGYEMLGAFFITLAIWSLLDFLESPGTKTAVGASVCSALYLLSHNYIVAFAPGLLALVALFSPGEADRPLKRAQTGIHLLFVRLVWVAPVLCAFIYRHALGHGLGKSVRLGFYLWDHLPGFVGNQGWPLALLGVGAACGSLAVRGSAGRAARLCALCGAAYLAPLFFLAPPGLTVVRGYMLVGTCFWVLGGAIVFGELAEARRAVVLGIGAVALLLTLWGTVESVFLLDGLLDPARVTLERGGVVRDPGTKAAGYLVQKHVPRSARVLAVHRAVEPPNLIYYFRRWRYAFYEPTPKLAAARLRVMKDEADVVICEAAHVEIMEADHRFPRRAVIVVGSEPRMWIYARRDVDLPEGRADARELNRAFDRECSWRVRFW